jgi:hypothetical protein
VSPNYTTIITPLRSSEVSAVKQYLRAEAEPLSCPGPILLQPKPLFPFHKIKNLHFCSFVIVEEEPGFEPTLIFEATFDGPQDEFIRDLLRVASQGMHEVYSKCVDYPSCGLATPELVKEYLLRHDVGAHIFFCGSPGRTVGQINGEARLRDKCAAFLSHRRETAKAIPPRMDGLFQMFQREFIRGRRRNRWAETCAEIPWEVKSRSLVVAAAIGAVLAAACGLGALVSILLFGWWPLTLHEHINRWMGHIAGFGDRAIVPKAPADPSLADLVSPASPAVHVLIGFAAVWLVIRTFELFFLLITDNPRDQFLFFRLPLHLFVIARYAVLFFLAGFAALGFFQALEGGGVPFNLGTFCLVLIATLLIVAITLVVLQYFAQTLKLIVELRPLTTLREIVRRLALDFIRFIEVFAIAAGILVIARHLPSLPGTGLSPIGQSLVHVYFVLLSYSLIGIFFVYGVALLVILLLGALEYRDEKKFSDPAFLVTRARENASKYAREEGGINKFQNHLTSITHVKPGFFRRWILRVTLFAIDLLSRFWFNRGELGGIPTILSARWVMIDEGRRLLFLDNYGGAWDSYLNEFIDLDAVKGLNAIWSNTFVRAAGQLFAFPRTRFLFWQGAQAEQPFKAYVRQSQLETIVWYSAYPTLSVVNINANSEIRQALASQSSTSGHDAILHLL